MHRLGASRAADVNRDQELEHLAQASLHIAEAKQHIARQLLAIQRLESEGSSHGGCLFPAGGV